MEIDQANLNDINGVNLKNYVPYQRTCDTVLYVHKRVFKEEEEEKARKTKKTKKKKKKDKINNRPENVNERKRNETVQEQTVRFAKHLAPIVIPSNESSSNTPVFYTIEACSKKGGRKKDGKPKEIYDDATYKNNKCKKIIETYRKERKHRRQHSTTESETYTSESDTLDDLNNPSFNCSISEQSIREKHVKNEVNSKRKRNKEKFIISESFEAVATECIDADDTTIKLQLMNDAEKNAFCDNIKSPILNAVRKFTESNNTGMREDVKSVQRLVKSNTDKLDQILDRLAYIEKHLQSKEYAKVSKSPRSCVKASTLEELGEDIDDEKSFGEEFEVKRNKIKYEDNRDSLGGGEVVSVRPSSSVGVKTDKPNKIPARYCWTDANKD